MVNYECRAVLYESLRKGTDMTMQKHSNQDLLALLLGKRKARELYKTPLSTLLFIESGSEDYVPELAIARELVRRSLEENLFQGNALTSPHLVRDYLKVILNGREHEVFVALFLDSQHRLIATEELFRGTLTQTSVYPREVVKRSLAVNAAAVIFAHNHPSGVAEPSKADEVLTHALKQALALVDVKVLDHFVVAGVEVVSLAERGVI
ncbi:MAG: DNA repair protein RadC [bacterium]|nr:DNA repair protein RadC [bacterium]